MGENASAVTWSGPVMKGAVWSPTVTAKASFGERRAASVAKQFTGVVAILNCWPEAGLQRGVIVLPAVSVAVTTYVTMAPVRPVASTYISLGKSSVGGGSGTRWWA